jgi:predicted O-linked N-acetylglucosamine transferase (SPINDLY family)
MANSTFAVDLKGHTEGSRPSILARRPCPVQVNYLGYPGTIGAPWLDYILADPIVSAAQPSAFLQRENRPPAALLSGE